MPPPAIPKVYHIVHVDRLASIVAEGGLLCDAEVNRRAVANPGHGMGTTIGMSDIKQRRMTELTLESHPGLRVGQCVPFYFCPRSVMLYVIHRANHAGLTYLGGQEPIVHLEADLHDVVDWADLNNRRWAFTLSNAGSYYFEDRADLAHLNEVDWSAVGTNSWAGGDDSGSIREGKQAEFLIERSFPWTLVARIGVRSHRTLAQVRATLRNATGHNPAVEIKPNWYY